MRNGLPLSSFPGNKRGGSCFVENVIDAVVDWSRSDRVTVAGRFNARGKMSGIFASRSDSLGLVHAAIKRRSATPCKRDTFCRP
jgi:hypothetical protein